MELVRSKGLWAGLLAAGVVVVVGALAMTGAAAADQKRGGVNPPEKIKMKLGEDGPFFRAPDSVDKGAKLTIINRTSVEEVGPHTFTLIDPALMDTRKERKKCENFAGKVCPLILEAHQVGPPPDFPVGRRNVDKGKNGWDKEFTKARKGDSWFTDVRGETEARKVKADAGETLGFFCLVHPFMRGEIEVE